MTKLLSFDEMKDMAANEPERFEEYRQEIINNFIAGLPVDKQERARQWQWRIEQRTRNIENPLVRLEIIYSEMMTSFIELNDMLNHGIPPQGKSRKKDAKVLDFKTKKPHK